MWLLFSTLSYFFLAFAGIFDRLVLVGSPIHSKTYASYVGILSGVLGLLLLPFIGFHFPDTRLLLISLGAGTAWVVFLWALYESVFQAGISRTAPAIGGFGPIFTLAWGFLFFGEQVILSPFGFLAFILFIVAGVILSRSENKARSDEVGHKFSPALFCLLLVTSFLFGLYLVILKMALQDQPFLEGFAWTRIGAAIPVPFFLLFSSVRKGVFNRQNIVSKQFLIAFWGAQLFGGVGVLFQQLSIFSASAKQVSFIPALIGVQYIFLYIFMVFLYRWRPELLKEAMAGRALWEKIFAASFVVAGLIMLALYT